MTHYELLGISKDASETEIKRAYREKALKYHPDKNAGDKEAEAMFKTVNEAYQTLGNSVLRKQYDAGLINEKGHTVFQNAQPTQPTQFTQTPTQTPRKFPSFFDLFNWDFSSFFTKSYPQPQAPKSTYPQTKVSSVSFDDFNINDPLHIESIDKFFACIQTKTREQQRDMLLRRVNNLSFVEKVIRLSKLTKKHDYTVRLFDQLSYPEDMLDLLCTDLVQDQLSKESYLLEKLISVYYQKATRNIAYFQADFDYLSTRILSSNFGAALIEAVLKNHRLFMDSYVSADSRFNLVTSDFVKLHPEKFSIHTLVLFIRSAHRFIADSSTVETVAKLLAMENQYTQQQWSDFFSTLPDEESYHLIQDPWVKSILLKDLRLFEGILPHFSDPTLFCLLNSIEYVQAILKNEQLLSIVLNRLKDFKRSQIPSSISLRTGDMRSEFLYLRSTSDIIKHSEQAFLTVTKVYPHYVKTKVHFDISDFNIMLNALKQWDVCDVYSIINCRDENIRRLSEDSESLKHTLVHFADESYLDFYKAIKWKQQAPAQNRALIQHLVLTMFDTLNNKNIVMDLLFAPTPWKPSDQSRRLISFLDEEHVNNIRAELKATVREDSLRADLFDKLIALEKRPHEYNNFGLFRFTGAFSRSEKINAISKLLQNKPLAFRDLMALNEGETGRIISKHAQRCNKTVDELLRQNDSEGAQFKPI